MNQDQILNLLLVISFKCNKIQNRKEVSQTPNQNLIKRFVHRIYCYINENQKERNQKFKIMKKNQINRKKSLLEFLFKRMFNIKILELKKEILVQQIKKINQMLKEGQ